MAKKDTKALDTAKLDTASGGLATVHTTVGATFIFEESPDAIKLYHAICERAAEDQKSNAEKGSTNDPAPGIKESVPTYNYQPATRSPGF